jgi:molecular chaperone GrpE
MSEIRADGTEDDVLGPLAAHEQEGAATPERVEVRDGVQVQESEPLEEADESSGAEDSLADKYLALAQRTQADFENYRKRMAREADAIQARGVVRLARELLPALDNLERALAAATSADNVDDQLIEGLRLVQRELFAAIERAGIERYGEPGERFDPELHEAVAQQPLDGVAPGAIAEIYQAGYRLAAVVIRPARVLVAA